MASYLLYKERFVIENQFLAKYISYIYLKEI